MTSVQQHKSEPIDHAEVAFHPPFLLLGSMVLGYVAGWLAPVEFLARSWTVYGGSILVAGSLGLFLRAATTMRSSGASIPTGEPTSSVVLKGPFRFSRNPIYLSMVSLLIAIGIWQNNLWFIGLAVVMTILLNRGVISREERYLERKFGDVYLAYKSRVRRWC